MFVAGLLDIDFARQSRIALGAWLVAEEAPDLMPGIPPDSGPGAVRLAARTVITGQVSTLPTANQWVADAKAGVRWSDERPRGPARAQWQQMIDAGWQPVDLRAAVEDVPGVLTVGGRTTRRRGPSRWWSKSAPPAGGRVRHRARL